MLRSGDTLQRVTLTITPRMALVWLWNMRLSSFCNSLAIRFCLVSCMSCVFFSCCYVIPSSAPVGTLPPSLWRQCADRSIRQSAKVTLIFGNKKSFYPFVCISPPKRRHPKKKASRHVAESGSLPQNSATLHMQKSHFWGGKAALCTVRGITAAHGGTLRRPKAAAAPYRVYRHLCPTRAAALRSATPKTWHCAKKTLKTMQTRSF